MAAVLKDVMARLDWALERPAYNLVLHTAPFSGEADLAFHWHLEVIPRVTRWSGLEWGTRDPPKPGVPGGGGAGSFGGAVRDPVTLVGAGL